jgi:sugar/nucleoside kinase (ribokinase family)
MLDVLLPSPYFCDLVFTGLPDIPRLGDEVFSQELKVMPGAGFIPAVALTRLGLSVGWSCDFGDDFFSRYVLEEAGRQNVNMDLFRKQARSLQAVSVSYSFAHDRAFLSYMDPLPDADLVSLVQENPARILLMMYLAHGPDFQPIVEAAHRQGMQVFMDGQVGRGTDLSNPDVEAAIRAVDLFAPNQKEALQITGETGVEAALARLAELVPTVIIKRGAGGVLASRGGTVVDVPGIPTRAVDTTGAGDNFNCGFLYGLLRGYSLEDCLRCGNFCGSQSTTALGGWTASPGEADLQAYLNH